MSGDAAVLQVQGLSKSFGQRRVLRDLDTKLGPGDRLALAGPNGSGKTTFLRCIAGTVTADAGSIRIAGFDAGSVEACASIGATIAHEKAFYLRLSGLQNLLFYASIRCRTPSEGRAEVDSLVQELEIGRFVGERADRYSSGMMQQLGLARALLARPALLLMDEPTRSLDTGAVGRLWAALDRRPDTSVVIASHRRSDLDRCGLHLDL